jgi:23S rRNA pseudouridine1911/1915/1917 synthase
VNEQTLQIEPTLVGARLDVALATLLPDISRTRAQALIRDGHVIVNAQVAAKPGLRLAAGDRIRVRLPEPTPSGLQPESIPLDVVFENADVLLVNKPAGMVVHPAAGHATGTLIHAALAHAPDLEGIGGEIRPGVVHRLDKDTSGLILLAKNDSAYRSLQQQFRSRSISKTYLAIAEGHPPTKTGKVEAPIGRDLKNRKRMAVVVAGRGRPAITTFRVCEDFRDACLLEAHPETGRTHQIRVHLAFLGCPVAGDRVYGHRRPVVEAPRQMLHAWRLRLVLPGESEPREFEAPVPKDFEGVLAELRGEAVGPIRKRES